MSPTSTGKQLSASSESTVAPFSSLVTELVIQILLPLDAVSIVRCCRVCRFLNDIIKESVELQYKIECDINGIDDNPRSNLDAREKLALLQVHCNVWPTLKWPSGIPFDITLLPEEPLPLRSGNLLICKRDQRSFTVHQVSSSYRGLPSKQWIIEDVGFTVWDYAVDASQDLLIVAGRSPSNDPKICSMFLQAISLSTGQAHPLASLLPMVILTHNPNARLGTKPVGSAIKISDNLVGLVLVGSEMRVWDWKEGQVHLDLYDEQYDYSFENRSASTFIFIPGSRILLTPWWNHCVLNSQMVIFACSPGAQRCSLKDASPEAILLLPTFRPTVSHCSSIYAYPDETVSNAADQQLPFHRRRTSRTAHLELTVSVGRSVVTKQLRLVMPFGLLEDACAHAAAAATRTLRWEAWATNVRMIAPKLQDGDMHNSSVCDTAISPEGFIAAHWEFTNASASALYYAAFYDFAPIQRLRRDLLSELIPVNTNWEYILEPEVIDYTDVFETSITTALPYRKIRENVKFHSISFLGEDYLFVPVSNEIKWQVATSMKGRMLCT